MAPVPPGVLQLASQQLGLVSVQQLEAEGVSGDQRRALRRQGWLIRVHRGVYRFAATPLSSRTPALAAVLAAGPGAVASHVTGARLWGLGATLREALRRHQQGRPDPALAAALVPVVAHSDRWPTYIVHLTAARQVRLPGVVGHRRTLPADERSFAQLVPVTSMERTLVDLSEQLDAEVLGRCVDEALRRGAALGRIWMLLDRHCVAGGPRRSSLDVVLARRTGGSDAGANAWERGMDDLWETLGLPASVRQYAVVTVSGRYILDRAIPELRIGIEWVGYEYHGRRHKFDADSYRRGDLAVAGWELIEVTSTWTPERLRRVVTAVVARRRLELGVPA